MDRDLWPWILGGVLITTGAIAAAIQFSARTSPAPGPSGTAVTIAAVAPAAPPASAATAAAPVAQTAAPAPPIATAPAAPAMAGGGSGPPPRPAPGAASSSPPLPPGEVWECTVNGQKVFSDTRCGSGASVRQLGDLNVMDVPPPRYVYGQPYGAYPPPAPYYPDDEDDGGDVNGDVYPSQIILARERARREHRHHQEFHARPSVPARGGAAARATH